MYKPGYSESEEQTDFTSDEERRERRGRLELAVTRPGSSPGSSCADTSVTPPPPASTDVSPDPSPLASYSHQSFTQSEMELVASPSVKTSSDAVHSSEAASLQWDDYDHEANLSFHNVSNSHL